MNEPVYIDRPPRIQPELPVGEVPIPRPQLPSRQMSGQLLQLGLPLVTILGYAFIAMFGGRQGSSLLLVPMALAAFASIGVSLYSYWKERQQWAESERAYAARLSEMYKEMQISHDLQRRFYRYNYPDLQTSAQIVREPCLAGKSSGGLRSAARLWERRVGDHDFGAVRLGIGALPSTQTYVLSDTNDEGGSYTRAAKKLAADSRFVSEIPVVISLRRARETDQPDAQREQQPQGMPTVHALGVAGEPDSVYPFARAVLAHYTIFHAPGDARLYVLADRHHPWDWARALPHCAGDEQNRQICCVDAIKAGPEDLTFADDEGDEIEQFLEGLRKTLAQRRLRLQEHEGSDAAEAVGDPTLPFLLVVIDLLDAAYDQGSRLHGIETDAAIAILLEEGAQLGAAVIFLVPERSKVPGGCQAVIEVERSAPASYGPRDDTPRLYFRYIETGVNAARYIGEADAATSLDELARLASDLGRLRVRQSAGATLPSAVPFLDLMGYKDLDDLATRARQHWLDSTSSRNANWLRVRLGLMAGNKPRALIFSAKRDGVHGMVAGSTGSGKSELLISLICGLAVTYDPSVLNFVLVDYKGGGAFKEFADLPHCVDIITNLAADGVTRMFTAIMAEMRRRQALNAATGTKNIVEYRKKNLHVDYAPYPFLFIIIDEFAEMIADRAEYKTALESITRVGRAQGVSLVLAAQRPSGVTDQMRSNIKFRICLRVETPTESREMLRRADAAFLPPGLPGRGYLQVGNEEIEQIQVAFTGDPYIDPRVSSVKVLWPDRGGGSASAQDQAPPELYKAIIAALRRLARDEGRPAQQAPWPGFLPRELYLSETLITAEPEVRAVTSSKYLAEADLLRITLGQPRPSTMALNPAINLWLNGSPGWVEALDWDSYAVRPVVGLVDNPYEARQLPLIVDLPRGHGIVFGASGSGKTTFLRSLVLSLAATHSPNHLHCYILDLGGRNLSVLGNLPHVGAVVIPDEEAYQERVEQVLREIGDLVEERKLLLSKARVADIYAYNREHPQEPQPAIVLVIDNMVEFIETFGAGEANVETALDRFVALARQSRAYGVHIVVSTGKPGDLSNQLLSLFTERFALRLADPTDYRLILGAGVEEFGDIPGRGYTRVGPLALSFQTARPIDLRRSGAAEPANEIEEIEQLAKRMNEYLAAAHRRYARPRRVDALPRTVLLREILARDPAHGLTLDAQFMPRLKELMWQWWAESLDRNRANWLSALIGVTSGNRPRTLALEAKRDGAHGMIAGGTGSGKSELLMTLIVSLALRYDPRVLNFVLVDYKGGGAFAPFERLPHCVEIVTNLNKGAVKRMFTAISAEMQRRQRLNTATGTKDIIDYRRKGYHPTDAPYPHLVIIIDEYAEMIAANPEFGMALDSITRLGRAQGITLLLAAQRPTGVSDQMRANIKLRICLRVEQAETSRELLRRADAAFLPGGMPGRGYIQSGSESIELIQVAFSGEADRYATPKENGEAPRFYELVVAAASHLHEQVNREPRPRTPWPPPLPATLSLGATLDATYLEPDFHAFLRRGGHTRVALNPAAQAWLDGSGRWPGIAWKQDALKAVVGLMDDPAQARQLPLTLDFQRGHAVIFGASGWGKTTLLRSLALSLAATHSPAELHLHALDMGGRGLECLQALPHLGTLIIPDERGYEERVQQLWRELDDIVERRKRLFSAAGAQTLYDYNAAAPAQVEPAILVLIDNIGELIETFGSDTRSAEEGNLLEAFVDLARQGKAFGLHFAITALRLNVLSGKLFSLFTERLTLRLANADEYSAIVGVHMPEVDELPGRGYMRVGKDALSFQVAVAPDHVDESRQIRNELRQIQSIGEAMKAGMEALGPVRPPLRIGALPRSVSYRKVVADPDWVQVGQPLDLAGPDALTLDAPDFLAALKERTAALWRYHADAAHADWLKVPLGVVSGDRTRTLRLEARIDGVHGMVAGGTGSGKSELLMTIIVGLALRYDPETLNFVLVDYKGGGAFAPFERLPHCVEIVTNLYPAAVARMFTAINAEMQRRQRLNAETGTKDIVEYRRLGRHRDYAPYPFLFIIIDEYAEMIDANEDFRLQLDSITRVGRAQGVHLLLASQQPKGVSDQMRANIKFRLCLRVEQMETSRELLRRPDAALLPNGIPGRGYLQVGNETIELIQVAYTGERQPDERPAAVLWPDRARPTKTSDGEAPRFFDAAVMLARELTGGRPTPKPWPAFLPERLSLESTVVDAQRGTSYRLLPMVSDWLNGDVAAPWTAAKAFLSPVLGLLDDPLRARQEPLRVDLARNHLAVFGDAGMGKTTLLRTLLVSLAATHSPDEVHFYVLDLGGRNFSSFARGEWRLPHLAAVLYADEEVFEERFQRLLDYLARAIEERQRMLGEAGAGSLADYNATNHNRAMPALVVIIDNLAELSESYRQLLEDRLIPLVRRGLGAGVSFVVSANLPSSMPSRLYALFTERLTFRQTSADRYLDIVGRGAMDVGELPGRGYARRDGRALLFQAALPVGLIGGDGRALAREADDLELLSKHMQAASRAIGRQAPLSDPIGILEPYVALDELLAEAGAASERRIEAVLGRGETLRPAAIDLRQRGPHLAIFGPPLSGKTTALYALAFSLAERYPPSRVAFVLVDTQGGFVDYGGSLTLADLPHTLAVVSEARQLEDVVAHLKEESASLARGASGRAVFVLVDNYDDFSEEAAREREALADLATLARRYGRSGVHFVITGLPDSRGDELKRRIMAANFGLALRTAGALEALRIERVPAAARGRELNVGRGYLVKAGQGAQIQVAAPYPPVAAGATDNDDDSQRIASLDRRVQSLSQRYAGRRATWAASAGAAPAAPTAPGEAHPVAGAMLDLIERALHQEPELLAGAENGIEPVAERFRRLDETRRTRIDSLRPILRSIYVRFGEARGNGSVASLQADAMGDQELIDAVERELREAAAARMRDLFQRAREALPEPLATPSNGAEPITARFDGLSAEERQDPARLRALLREAYSRLVSARAMAPREIEDDRTLFEALEHALVAARLRALLTRALSQEPELLADGRARFESLSAGQRADPAPLRDIARDLALRLGAARGAEAEVRKAVAATRGDEELIRIVEEELKQRIATRMASLIEAALRAAPALGEAPYHGDMGLAAWFEKLKTGRRADPGSLNGVLRALYIRSCEARGAGQAARDNLASVRDHQSLIALVENELAL